MTPTLFPDLFPQDPALGKDHYTPGDIAQGMKLLRLRGKMLGTLTELPKWVQTGRINYLHWTKEVTNRETALSWPYCPGLKCRNLRDALQQIQTKQLQRENRSRIYGCTYRWRYIPHEVKDRIAQAIWERKGRPEFGPAQCNGATWTIGIDSGQNRRAGVTVWKSKAGRLFAWLTPALPHPGWDVGPHHAQRMDS